MVIVKLEDLRFSDWTSRCQKLQWTLALARDKQGAGRIIDIRLSLRRRALVDFVSDRELDILRSVFTL